MSIGQRLLRTSRRFDSASSLVGVALVLLANACSSASHDVEEPAVAQVTSALTHARGLAGDLVADNEVGRRDFTEIEPREIVPDKLNIPGGVVVDKSVSPGRAYIWDAGNSRILGIDLAQCYATPVGSRCQPQLIFGQPSGSDHGGCNLDSSAQQYPARPPASASTLCGVRETTHTVLEDKSFANMYVDGSGNLWVPDALNHRVLKYNSPFTTDTVADAVFGQPNFTANGCNGAATWTASPSPTASTLCFYDENNNGGAWGSGVRLDAAGNLWVADGGNNRILRFKNNGGTIATSADIVLGQSSFTTRAPGTALNQLSSPEALLFDASGKLYVTDSGNHRVLVYPANVVSGQSATSTFGSFPSDQFGPQALELDPDVRGIWTTDFSAQGSIAQLWSFSGQLVSGVQPISIQYNSGGSIAFDAQKQLLLTDYIYGQDLLRYVQQAGGFYNNDRSFFSPPNMYNLTTARRFEAPAWVGVGVADKVSNPKQLIVADGRLMFWNNPSTISLGQAPTDCVGSCTNVSTPFNQFPTFEQVKVDASDRVWVSKQSEIDVYQAPLTSGAFTIGALVSIPVLGGGTISLGQAPNDVHGIAPTPDGQYLWVTQPGQHRVFRVRGPLTGSPVVDVILGQSSLVGQKCNRANTDDPFNTTPNLTTLCWPGAISLDRQGNLYVSDHFLEIKGNFRLLMFASSMFPASPANVIYGPAATKEFPRVNPQTSFQMASFEPAFDTSNRMVVGINPYAGTRYVQYYNNPTSLNPSNPSDPTFAVPSGQLEDFYGWPVASTFDSSNNLYVYDANRGRVNIYNTPFGATARYHSGDTVQAEAYTSQSGTQLQTNGTTVGNFDAGDSLCYDGVDFTGITNLAMTLASANSGGVFSVRIDSPTGTELGRTTVQSTGGWSTWQVKNVSVSQTSGIHTLCLHGESGSGITNLDSFQLGASGGLPDLVVTAVNWSPANIAAGQPATFSATVKNQGSGATPAGVIIGVSFSVDGTQVNWSDTDTTSLAAGASVTLTANSGPSGSATWTTTAGLHSVQAWVDDVNRMAESNESNNQLSVSLPIGIDLTVTSVTWSPTSPHSGNAVLFSATVKNKGTVATPAGVIVGVRFDVDGNAVSWSDTDTTSLAPGASVTLTANSGPSGNANWNATSGTHTVQGWVDDVNRMTDVDRSNNKLLTSLSVP